MTSAEPRPYAPRKYEELISIGFSTTIAVLAVVYTAVPFIAVLVAWQLVAVVYLALLFTVFRNRSMRGIPPRSRAVSGRLLERLSWVLPITASAAGVTSAITLLTTDGASGEGDADAVVVGLLGSVGVIVAWLLLQTGFAEIYESIYERLPEATMISFPGIDEDPTLGDFLYLSFTVGTSFAISGATIASRRVRRVVLVQSITSFFYNAFLIAVAIQVVQGIIARG